MKAYQNYYRREHPSIPDDFLQLFKNLEVRLDKIIKTYGTGFVKLNHRR